ncbi:MAG: hypothetical protein BMS9Abin36_0833 [Gammaproteobacteria bacterium]|nr:MAG: hypothetical protein BMS9Abin36_0833 [Gammaproteobacteria bacterium]
MVPVRPAGGKSNETGYDKSYVMESIVWPRCTQASQGIVILDNKAGERYGSKAKGAVDMPVIGFVAVMRAS